MLFISDSGCTQVQKPRQCYLKKYASPKQCTALQLYEIKMFGRQILDTLKYMHDKGFPYGQPAAYSTYMYFNIQIQV